MAPPDPLPQFIYKIIPTAPPEPIPDPYPLSELDQKDGFVHLSAAFQVPITLGLFFNDSTEVWILRLRRSHFPEEKVKWDETEGTNGCPHLYGNFGTKDVESVKAFKREAGQSWADAAKGYGDWLV
ncbi:hypothetical protein GQ53DRAFT_822150 [Thozetella sp. PMI_491]|nr:hypothetical protein GQ53DRAFT_822150 [Thozetella sp. PMI_491]